MQNTSNTALTFGILSYVQCRLMILLGNLFVSIYFDPSRDLCQDILGALSTLRGLPVDILSGHLDITGLAVDTARKNS